MLLGFFHMQHKPKQEAPQPKTRAQQIFAGSITLAGPDPDRGLQPPGHLLEKQHSELQAVQDTTGVR